MLDVVHAVLHYLGGTNGNSPWYLIPSGQEGDVALYGGLILALLHRNCHVDGCKSFITTNDPKVHANACRNHHSLGHLHGRSHRPWLGHRDRSAS